LWRNIKKRTLNCRTTKRWKGKGGGKTSPEGVVGGGPDLDKKKKRRKTHEHGGQKVKRQKKHDYLGR